MKRTLLSNQTRNYSMCNKLTLEERMKVIKAYKRCPVYQMIAKCFHCSPMQIRTIILNQAKVIRDYKNQELSDPTGEARKKRQQKIDFLNKVMLEYVERAVYHGVPINEEIVRQRALQVQECIAIDDFFPNYMWMKHFKVKYNIAKLDLARLRKSMVLTKPKENTFHSMDLIEYVSRQEKEELLQQAKRSNGDSSMLVSKLPVSEAASEPTIINAAEQEADSDDAQPMTIVEQDSEEKVHMDIKIEDASSDISSFPEALQVLRNLEGYAMLRQNYKAIGIIAQLEDAFKNQDNSSDFEL